MKKTKFLSGVLLVCLLFTVSGCGVSKQETKGDEKDKKVQVALLLPGTITDSGWNAAAYDGLLVAKEKYDLEVAYTESVPLAEQEQNIRDYASRGFNLIICHGNDFADAVKNVAAEFPQTYFAISNSNIKLDNAIGMDVKNEEQGYVMGYALALASKTNKIGFVGALEILPMKRAEAGFKQGVKDANPNAECIVAYTGSVDDLAKGKETTLAMFDKGVDAVVMYANASGLGVIQAAKEKGKFVAVTNKSQVELAPDMATISVQPQMKVNILAAIDAYVKGSFNSQLSIVGGFDTGLYEVNFINEKNLSADKVAQIKQQVEKLKSGEIKVKFEMK